MNGMRCKLCRSCEGIISYEVQRDKPLPVCGRCIGSWAPHELNKLLGVVPDDLEDRKQMEEKAHAVATQG